MIYLILMIIAAVILVAIVIRRLPYLRSHRLGLDITRSRYSRPSWVSDFWYRITSFFSGLRKRKQPTIPNSTIPGIKPYMPSRNGSSPLSERDDSPMVAHPDDFWQEEQQPASPLDMGDQGLVTRRGESQKIAQELISHAESAFRKKDYKEAEKYYLQAATKDPHNARVYNRLGVIYLSTKNYKDAVEAFRNALKFDDRIASRHYNLALAYLGKRDYRSAEKGVREAIQLDPTNDKYQKTLESIQKQL